MPSLQIRDVPAPLHQLLIRRARAHKRSLGQQALHDLEQLAGGDALQRRRLALARLNQLWEGRPRVALTAPPEDLIVAYFETMTKELRSLGLL